MGVKHTQQIVGQDNLGRQVSANAWNVDHTIDSAIDLTDGSTMGSDDLCKIKMVTYTGDGAAGPGGQQITGVGFLPKYVKIFKHTFIDASVVEDYYKPDTYPADGGVKTSSNTFETGRVLALLADGFTVADDGADRDPNTNGQAYSAMCLG